MNPGPALFNSRSEECNAFIWGSSKNRTGAVQKIVLGPAPFNSSQKTSGVYPVGPGDRTGAYFTGAVQKQKRNAQFQPRPPFHFNESTNQPFN